MSSQSSNDSPAPPASSTMNVSTSPLGALDALSERNVVFLCCDIQETFRGKILDYDPLIATASFLLRAANALNIPVITTEQKPFKPTVSELAPLLDPAAHPNCLPVYGKTLFSMVTPEVLRALGSGACAGRRHAVVFGIEAHVCVLQTSFDLLRRGYIVHLVTDAISSQNRTDRDTALRRLEAEAARSSVADAQAGTGVAHFTTAESVWFEMVRDAAHPRFKEMVPALKELAKVKAAANATSATGNQAKL